MLGSISFLHPLDARSTHCCDNPECLQTFPNILQGPHHPWVRTTDLHCLLLSSPPLPSPPSSLPSSFHASQVREELRLLGETAREPEQGSGENWSSAFLGGEDGGTVLCHTDLSLKGLGEDMFPGTGVLGGTSKFPSKSSKSDTKHKTWMGRGRNHRGK